MPGARSILTCKAQFRRIRSILFGERVAANSADRKSTRLNSSHDQISYAVFCLKKKNSFTSVSLDPPLVLICVDLYSTALPFFRASGNFAVNVLTSEQEALSRCFATTSAERYEHFCHASYHIASTGSPIFDDALAFIDSRIVAEYPGGDHVIFVGHVVAMGTDGQAAFTGEEDHKQNNLIELKIGEESQANNLNHNDQKAPLVYYRGQYR